MSVDGDADDLGGFGQPLPPDDRLWRHPSELAALGTGPGATPGPGRSTALGAAWVTVLAAGVAGAVLATGFLVATGGLGGQVVERQVIERVAMSPVVSSPMLRGDLGVVAITDRTAPSVAGVEVTTRAGQRRGSAVAFRSDGHLLTSASLVEGATSVVVVVNGSRRTAEVVGSDPLTDVAVLVVASGDVPVAVLADGDELVVGQPTLTLSGPTAGSGPTVATGVVSALGRRLDRSDAEPLHGLIQLDVPVPDGSLGAPVLDSSGAVIGLATISDRPGGFGFAVPVETARRVAHDLVAYGAAQHCWLGISGVDLDADRAGELGVAGGAVVHEVSEASPASDGGLAGGDVITAVDGEPLQGVSHLVAELRLRRPGDQVTLGYWRDGTHAEVEVTLAPRP